MNVSQHYGNVLLTIICWQCFCWHFLWTFCDVLRSLWRGNRKHLQTLMFPPTELKSINKISLSFEIIKLLTKAQRRHHPPRLGKNRGNGTKNCKCRYKECCARLNFICDDIDFPYLEKLHHVVPRSAEKSHKESWTNHVLYARICKQFPAKLQHRFPFQLPTLPRFSRAWPDFCMAKLDGKGQEKSAVSLQETFKMSGRVLVSFWVFSLTLKI